MWQLLPIIILPIATIALAYILEILAVAIGIVGSVLSGIPDWISTAVLSVVVIATYRSMRE